MTDCSTTIAGQKHFFLKGDSFCSLPGEEYGFRLHCPKGAVSKNTEVTVTALVNGNYRVPEGTVLVSAVYKILMSNPLLKSLIMELQHCVDLKNTGQTGCLKFVRAPLNPPYQFSVIDGGSFTTGNRYGSIEQNELGTSLHGIVAEMRNGVRDSKDAEIPSDEGSVDVLAWQ